VQVFVNGGCTFGEPDGNSVEGEDELLSFSVGAAAITELMERLFASGMCMDAARLVQEYLQELADRSSLRPVAGPAGS